MKNKILLSLIALLALPVLHFYMVYFTDLYKVLPHFDMAMHALAALLLAIIFSEVIIKMYLGPKRVWLYSILCIFMIACGWEIAEYGYVYIVHNHMERNHLDTLKDIVITSGSGVFSTYGYLKLLL